MLLIDKFLLKNQFSTLMPFSLMASESLKVPKSFFEEKRQGSFFEEKRRGSFFEEKRQGIKCDIKYDKSENTLTSLSIKIAKSFFLLPYTQNRKKEYSIYSFFKPLLQKIMVWINTNQIKKIEFLRTQKMAPDTKNAEDFLYAAKKNYQTGLVPIYMVRDLFPFYQPIHMPRITGLAKFRNMIR